MKFQLSHLAVVEKILFLIFSFLPCLYSHLWRGNFTLIGTSTSKLEYSTVENSKKLKRILYRSPFLRKKQKCHPKSTFQNLKSLISPIKSIKTVTFCLLFDLTHFFSLKKLQNILLEKIKISNFETWSWDVIFVPFSEKVTCNNVNLLNWLDWKLFNTNCLFPECFHFEMMNLVRLDGFSVIKKTLRKTLKLVLKPLKSE